jgi:hypothetical protein
MTRVANNDEVAEPRVILSRIARVALHANRGLAVVRRVAGANAR